MVNEVAGTFADGRRKELEKRIEFLKARVKEAEDAVSAQEEETEYWNEIQKLTERLHEAQAKVYGEPCKGHGASWRVYPCSSRWTSLKTSGSPSDRFYDIMDRYFDRLPFVNYIYQKSSK